MINDISNTIWGLEILNNDTYLSLDEKITDIHRVRCYLFNTCTIWAVHDLRMIHIVLGQVQGHLVMYDKKWFDIHDISNAI